MSLKTSRISRLMSIIMKILSKKIRKEAEAKANKKIKTININHIIAQWKDKKKLKINTSIEKIIM
jgi:hypothetical protein